MFVPYHSEKGTADLTAADALWRSGMEVKLDQLRRFTVRWVPCLQFISSKRPEMHWCTYDDGRVVAFVELKRGEIFADLEEIYDYLRRHVLHLKSLGNYKGKFVDEPDPEDETDVHWRKWRFQAGDCKFVLNCGFMSSGHCKIVVDGTETVTVEKKRVVCDDMAA